MKDLDRKMFKTILEERGDKYPYVAFYHNKTVQLTDEYIEDGVRRGGGYFVAEDQATEGNTHPIIYKFKDAIDGSEKIARLLTQKEYQHLLRDVNEKRIVKNLE
mgnify:CR=1 FL=1